MPLAVSGIAERRAVPLRLVNGAVATPFRAALPSGGTCPAQCRAPLRPRRKGSSRKARYLSSDMVSLSVLVRLPDLLFQGDKTLN